MKKIFFLGFVLLNILSVPSYGIKLNVDTSNFQEIPDRTNLSGQQSDCFFYIGDKLSDLGDGKYVVAFESQTRSQTLHLEQCKEIQSVVDLDKSLDNVGDKHSKDYTHRVITKQSYIIPNITSKHFGSNLDLYKEVKWQQSVMMGLDHHFIERNNGETEWFAYRDVGTFNRIFINDFVAQNFHKKMEKSDFHQILFSVLEKIDLGIPDRIGVTSSPHFYNPFNFKNENGNKSFHKRVKGTTSITMWYEINGNKDVLVVTYQIVWINAISEAISGKIVDMIVNDFISGTAKSIYGQRKYFSLNP